MDFQWFSHLQITGKPPGNIFKSCDRKVALQAGTTIGKAMGKSWENHSWGDLKYVLCLSMSAMLDYRRIHKRGLYEIDSANVNDFHVFFRSLEMVYMGEVFEPPKNWQGPLDHVPWGDGLFFQQTGQKKVLCWKLCVYIYIFTYINTILSTWFSQIKSWPKNISHFIVDIYIYTLDLRDIPNISSPMVISPRGHSRPRAPGLAPCQDTTGSVRSSGHGGNDKPTGRG